MYDIYRMYSMGLFKDIEPKDLFDLEMLIGSSIFVSALALLITLKGFKK